MYKVCHLDYKQIMDMYIPAKRKSTNININPVNKLSYSAHVWQQKQEY